MLLQPLFGMQKINITRFQDYKLAKKEDKNTGKNKSTDISLADAPNRK